MHLILLLLLFIFVNSGSALFPYVYPEIELIESKLTGKAGDPLIITPYLKNGSREEAQELSKVSITSELQFESHAGFFTVDEKYDSNLYFWYFPAFSKNPNAPVILWLQGGPGGSSLFGLFTEMGPIIATKEGFKLRKYHWALNAHLVFIDNPVGTGFSFTKKKEGYCSDQNCVAHGLYSAMQQFFTLFPKLRRHDFYLTGESYAGKYIPVFAMEIHEQNNKNKNKINLKGIALGNGFCDPVNQLDYSTFLYELGLVDSHQLVVLEKLQSKIAAEINKEAWAKACLLMDLMLNNYFKNYTGFHNYYNFLKTNAMDITQFAKLLQNDKVRQSVHVGNLPFNSGKEVQLHLALDILKSVAFHFKTLLSNYRVLMYNGQLDIIVAYPLTMNFLQSLDFSSASEYKTAKREIWKVDNEIAGYVKRAGNLTEVLVRNAGHMVPSDQPKWAFDMIMRFIKGTL